MEQQLICPSRRAGVKRGDYSLMINNSVRKGNELQWFVMRCQSAEKVEAFIDEYNNSDCIQEKILSTDNEAIIKHVTEKSVDEVTSVDNPDDVYEYLTNDGMYYSFGKDGKTYIVTIDSKEWKGSMLKEMDEWCLENSK